MMVRKDVMAGDSPRHECVCPGRALQTVLVRHCGEIRVWNVHSFGMIATSGRCREPDRGGQRLGGERPAAQDVIFGGDFKFPAAVPSCATSTLRRAMLRRREGSVGVAGSGRGRPTQRSQMGVQHTALHRAESHRAWTALSCRSLVGRRAVWSSALRSRPSPALCHGQTHQRDVRSDVRSVCVADTSQENQSASVRVLAHVRIQIYKYTHIHVCRHLAILFVAVAAAAACFGRCAGFGCGVLVGSACLRLLRRLAPFLLRALDIDDGRAGAPLTRAELAQAYCNRLLTHG